MATDSNRLLIFGMGYSGTAIAEAVKEDFARVCGTTRSESKRSKLEISGFEGELFAGFGTPQLREHLQAATHMIVSIAPSPKDPVLEAFPALGQVAGRLQWIGYLSTVGVYGNHNGDWVNEETQVRPVSDRSIARVKAERAWQEMADTMNIPLGIFRLSGIYGPGRNAFVTIEKGKSRRLIKPGQVFNRIHRDDIARAVKLAMESREEGIFNITDDLPAPPQDVVTLAHELMGLNPPPEQDFETAELSPMARSFYGENKRVSNQKSKKVLGLEYRWPNYKVALKEMWHKDIWR